MINVLRLSVVLVACLMAYNIRLHALTTYGNVIHEFDPWFNFRATVYLEKNGATKFFQWYDDKVWYPLGRPVGATIYPGMQFTAVGLFNILKIVGIPMTLNDVCCYIPVWFGVLSTLLTGLLTYECTHDLDMGVVATLIMSIVPAHLMRSVGGGYDNESVAVATMCATFYFWCRSLRSKDSYLYGGWTALAYFCMVSTWGGYVFVLNMIALHTALLVLVGRASYKLHHAYSLFYILGTVAAMQVPIVGMAPLKSLEQLGALVVFLLVQLWYLVQQIRTRQDPKGDWGPTKSRRLYTQVFGGAVLCSAIIIGLLVPPGYFGPISSRVRGLFIAHTRTGNPLVDSVAEHQPADADAYFHYLHSMFYWYPVGLLCLCWTLSELSDSKIFLILYGGVAYYFSSKMVRLILLMGQIGSILASVGMCTVFNWSRGQFKHWRRKSQLKKITTVVLLLVITISAIAFGRYSHQLAPNLSSPSIMFEATLSNGDSIIVDDYREAYGWLREKTPIDARVMAWWDYGYQINGIAERTTLADGNTWNQEHIAMIGRCFVSPEKEAHQLARHLADYVLVWSGYGGDIPKSPHMARISQSVFNNTCPGDPTCARFGFVGTKQEPIPTPMMAASLIYKLDGRTVDTTLFEHVFTSKYRLVHIYRILDVSQDSKTWVQEHPRYYPPEVVKMLSDSENFRQSEDFN